MIILVQRLHKMEKVLKFNFSSDDSEGVDYKVALKNLGVYHEYYLNGEYKEINIVNIPQDKFETYMKIFEHIAKGGRLVYKAGSIFGAKNLSRKLELNNNRKILFDFKHTIHACFGNTSDSMHKEKEVALLVLNERSSFL
jgi:hypothetical protein